MGEGIPEAAKILFVFSGSSTHRQSLQMSAELFPPSVCPVKTVSQPRNESRDQGTLHVLIITPMLSFVVMLEIGAAV